MEFLNAEVIAYLITAVLGVVGSIFGTKYAELKKVFRIIVESAEDEKITPEEVQKIIIAIKGLETKK